MSMDGCYLGRCGSLLTPLTKIASIGDMSNISQLPLSSLLFLHIFVAKRIFVLKNNCFKLFLILSKLSDKSSFLFWVASDLSLFQPKQNMFLELTLN